MGSLGAICIFNSLLSVFTSKQGSLADAKDAHRTRGVSGTLQGSMEQGDLVNSEKEC